MNLIEQLDGYEKAKSILLSCKRYGRQDVKVPVVGGFIHIVADFLELDLLKYRRQHNIFEVGDYVLPNSNHSDEVHFLSEWYIDGLDFRYKTNSGDWGVIVKSCMTDSWRHATDAEIEAGKRLEVS